MMRGGELDRYDVTDTPDAAKNKNTNSSLAEEMLTIYGEADSDGGFKSVQEWN